ncbi:uncharacterized protein PHALS_06443 [Plasmopara halstedii]|uniref:Uncharacterized protein n=1 Tax=Plasmopara halstedii TaxID=4781 RepID=A0A0P1B2W7_PLAHL|nr:uncharacterized protein PHALS_06443 [Plasmopara halstedii]CEG48631.1 hypothetical protein PHALS_06443 [Plasmopara halstedii]|eukprot:XP_024585000.1 hypothetical protein PHALS_06443 [Plasmopara halstedii]
MGRPLCIANCFDFFAKTAAVIPVETLARLKATVLIANFEDINDVSREVSRKITHPWYGKTVAA